MENIFNFVYVTTNLINGKCYVGDHTTNMLNDGYLGSGRPYFKSALKKYGKENFKREILEFFPTKQEAFNAQEKYIIQFNTISPNGYNISPVGGCSCGIKCHSDESKQKISKGNKGQKRTTETKLKLSIKGKERIVSEETKKKISDANKGKISPMKGKTHTLESKEKMSIGNKDKQPRLGKHLSLESKKKIGDKNKIKLLNNKNGLGYKHSDAAKLEIAKKMSGENNPMYGFSPDKILCIYCDKSVDYRNYSRWHGEKCKLFTPFCPT
jgi:group I intron endonuclease